MMAVSVLSARYAMTRALYGVRRPCGALDMAVLEEFLLTCDCKAIAVDARVYAYAKYLSQVSRRDLL